MVMAAPWRRLLDPRLCLGLLLWLWLTAAGSTAAGGAHRCPALVAVGDYLNQTDHHDGHYHLRLTGERVTATFATSRSAVAAGTREGPAPLFTVPSAFRPPYPILRTVVGQPVRADGNLDPDRRTPRRFLVQVGADGAVHYGDQSPGADYLAYALQTVWGTTPAANDRAVLEILDEAWFDAPMLSRTPPPERHESHLDYIVIFPPSGLFVTLRADGRVTELAVDYQDLSRPIPPALGELTALEHLDLGKPILTSYPDPSRSGVTGAIPPELGQLTQLKSLRLSGNYLTGAIPPELGHLTQLKGLSLAKNLLIGPIPPELGQLTQLNWLGLGKNLLTGEVPPELGHLVGLYHLDLRSLDYDLVREKLPALVQAGLELPAAPLTGVLPSTLGQLTNLGTLHLSMNHFSGLPPELGQLPQLHTLTIDHNQLTSLPPELGQLAQLQDLRLSGNQLTSLPPELGQLAQLQDLRLSGNQLTSLPPELGQLAQLQVLWLSGNQLASLPPELGQLAQLQSLGLSGNQLASLPPELGQLAQLQSLGLSGNQLTTLPPELGQLSQLRDLYLQHNRLTTLPPELDQLSQLQSLGLSGNQLTGCLPRVWQARGVIIKSSGNERGPNDLPFCEE